MQESWFFFFAIPVGYILVSLCVSPAAALALQITKFMPNFLQDELGRPGSQHISPELACVQDADRCAQQCLQCSCLLTPAATLLPS